MVAGLLLAGCSGNAATVVPQPSGSPAPPVATGRGTLAVIGADSKAHRVWIFPPHSDTLTRELVFPGSRFQPNSLAFDRRGHLYVGVNDTAGSGEYEVVEVDVQSLDVVREIRGLPQWPKSSVAVDDQNELYVNTKAFIGGDVKIYRPNQDKKPYLEIRDHHSPLTMLIAASALWVGYEGAFADALARYRLRSKDRSWFQTIGRSQPVSLAANADGSLVAAFVRRDAKRAVDVYDVKSGKLARTLIANNGLLAMTSDESGHIFVSEGGSGVVHACNFRGCTLTFDTSGRPVALAVSPLDGNLYVANTGKTNVQAFDSKTGALRMTIHLAGLTPSAIAIEP
jgi:sugar lactone lactonase YvrE